MGVRLRIVAAVAAVSLLLSVGLLSHSEAKLPGQQGGGYVVERGWSSGEGYRLLSVSWQVEGVTTGDGYSLMSPAAPALRGSGCCCTYLPCVGRNN